MSRPTAARKEIDSLGEADVARYNVPF